MFMCAGSPRNCDGSRSIGSYCSVSGGCLPSDSRQFPEPLPPLMIAMALAPTVEWVVTAKGSIRIGNCGRETVTWIAVVPTRIVRYRLWRRSHIDLIIARAERQSHSSATIASACVVGQYL